MEVKDTDGGTAAILRALVDLSAKVSGLVEKVSGLDDRMGGLEKRMCRLEEKVGESNKKNEAVLENTVRRPRALPDWYDEEWSKKVDKMIERKREPEIAKADTCKVDERATPPAAPSNATSLPWRAPTKVEPMRLHTYDGKSSLKAYLIQFRAVAENNQWTEAEQARQLLAALRGTPLDFVTSLSAEGRGDIRALALALSRRFDEASKPEEARRRLKTRREKSGEDLGHLADEIHSLCLAAYCGTSEPILNGLAVDHFLDALEDKELAAVVRPFRPSTLSDAVLRVRDMRLSHQRSSYGGNEWRNSDWRAAGRQGGGYHQYSADARDQPPRPYQEHDCRRGNAPKWGGTGGVPK
jgi:hypothetical protein